MSDTRDKSRKMQENQRKEIPRTRPLHCPFNHHQLQLMKASDAKVDGNVQLDNRARNAMLPCRKYTHTWKAMLPWSHKSTHTKKVHTHRMQYCHVEITLTHGWQCCNVESTHTRGWQCCQVPMLNFKAARLSLCEEQNYSCGDHLLTYTLIIIIGP